MDGISMTLGLAAGYWWPQSLRLVGTWLLRRRCREQRCLVLSYDDGPGRELTPAVLELLRGFHARASFFVLAATLAGNAGDVRELLCRMRREGHDVGGHSMSHAHAWKCTPWRAWHETQECLEKLSPWLEPGRLYRPPFGKLCLPTLLALSRHQGQLAWWTDDSGDTHDPMPDPQRIVAQIDRQRGGVVLLHDFDRSAPRMEYVLELTRQLLQWAEKRHIAVRPLSELLGGTRPPRWNLSAPSDGVAFGTLTPAW